MTGPPLTIVTGASSGIGAALACHLARRGAHLALVGRNVAGLAAAAERVERLGAVPLVGALDVTTPALARWIAELAERHTFTALYANAGLSAGPQAPDALESESDTQRLVATNVGGTITTVREVVTAMRRQTPATVGAATPDASQRERSPKRRIAVVASVAGLLPTPDLAVYSATKAALIAYAHALRPRLAGENITVTALCPGFVTSPMSARHRGAKPFEMNASAAAARIVRATEAGARTAVFPWQFAILATVAALAPGALIDAVVPRFAATIEPDPREDG